MKIPAPRVPKFTLVERALLLLDRSGDLHYNYCLWRIARQKFIWKCARCGGGGTLRTPRPMTRDKAEKWLIARIPAGEIIFVDEENKFIFYQTHAS